MKLKPCPFCGGKAEFYRYEVTTDCGKVVMRFVLRCSQCGASTHHSTGDVRVDLCKDGAMWFSDNDITQAIEAWNRRCDNDN